MAKAKITFAAIPARAIGDRRLKGLHLKALGAVALHDRLSGARKKGQGCWAGNKRLAELIGCNYSNLSAALSDLAEWDYIDRRTNPMNKTRRILFIIYDERDGAFMTTNNDENPLPTDKQSAADDDDNGAEDSLPTDKDDVAIVCPDFQTSHEYQSLNGGEYIPQKRGRNYAEALGTYSAEALTNSDESASPTGDAKNSPENEGKTEESELNSLDSDGQFLGRVQTWLKRHSPGILTDHEIEALTKARDECFRIDDKHSDHNGGIGGWAQRLGSELDWLIEGDTDDGAAAMGGRA